MRNAVTRLLMNVRYKGYSQFYSKIFSNPYRPLPDLIEEQNQQLRMMIRYATTYVPYYKDLFTELKLHADDIQKQEDLRKLPLLTKEIIKRDPERFFSLEQRPYLNCLTGGSTGVPLKYRIDKECNMYNRAIVQRGRNCGDCVLGDTFIALHGGASPHKSRKLLVKEFFLGCYSYYAFGSNEQEFKEIYHRINKSKIRFGYGYASAWALFAEYIEKLHLSFAHPLRAVFTTSEILTTSQRQLISRALNTEVFDCYGLNDGGVTAYECEKHQGLHIDFERSILQVIDDNGQLVKEGTGHIIATTLHNFSMPFINYDTSDMATITYGPCSCGRTTPRLLAIQGRSCDYLKFGDTYIMGTALISLMKTMDILCYQVIQDAANHVYFKIVMNNYTDTEKQMKYTKKIEQSIRRCVPNIEITVDFFENISDLNIKKKNKFIYNAYLQESQTKNSELKG